MKNLAVSWNKAKNSIFLPFLIAGLLWGLQSVSFVGEDNAMFSPFALLLGAVFFSIAHYLIQVKKGIFPFFKFLISYFFGFICANIFIYETFVLSRQHKILFRLLGARDALSGSVLNASSMAIADIWISFLIFSFVCFSLVQLLSNEFSWKKLLKACFWVCIGVFFSPVAANLFSLLFSMPKLSPVISLTVMGLFIALGANEINS